MGEEGGKEELGELWVCTRRLSPTGVTVGWNGALYQWLLKSRYLWGFMVQKFCGFCFSPSLRNGGQRVKRQD